VSVSDSDRYTLWQVTWKNFASHPFLGVRARNYEATYYQDREQNVGWIRQPHSLPLEVLFERGGVGGVLSFGFFIIYLGGGLWCSLRSE
jgi:O-antigen ligase